MSRAWQGSKRGWKRTRAAVLLRDGYRCQIAAPGTWLVKSTGRVAQCLGVADCVDHIVPLWRGGARHDPRNMRAACTPCNLLLAGHERAAAARTSAVVTPAPGRVTRW